MKPLVIFTVALTTALMFSSCANRDDPATESSRQAGLTVSDAVGEVAPDASTWSA